MGTIKKSELSPDQLEAVEELEADYAEAIEALEAVTKAAEDLQSKLATAEEQLVTAGIKDDPDNDEQFEKLLEKSDPAVREFMKAERAKTRALQAKIEKQERDDHERTMLAKAKALKNLTVSEDDLKDVLSKAYDVPVEVTKADGTKATRPLGEQIEQILKAANAQLEEAGVWGEYGRPGGGEAVGSRVESAAAELRKQDPTLTAEQAIAKAYEQDPSLYVTDITTEV